MESTKGIYHIYSYLSLLCEAAGGKYTLVCNIIINFCKIY